MRAIVQRVSYASVAVDSNIVGEINKGYLVLLGVKTADSKSDVEYLANKIANLRVMSDENQKMNLNLKNANGEILVVSQFTLYANTVDGNRPSFLDAADPELAKRLYNMFVAKLRERNLVVKTGSFGEYMNISAKLDGPVTIIYDTNDK